MCLAIRFSLIAFHEEIAGAETQVVAPHLYSIGKKLHSSLPIIGGRNPARCTNSVSTVCSIDIVLLIRSEEKELEEVYGDERESYRKYSKE